MEFKPKILIIDDEEGMLNLLGDVLGRMGARTRLVAKSREAAQLFEQEKFDGVFLDWRMPDLSGADLARRLRKSKSNAKIPIVVLTGDTSPAVLKEAFQAGVNFFLQKPVSVEQLRHLLNASRGQMLKERRSYQRVRVELAIHCRWQGGQAKATTVDLSASGVLLALPQAPPKDAILEMDLALGDGPDLTLRGAVVRLLPGPPAGHPDARGVGVHFQHRRDQDRERLVQFVDTILTAQGSAS